MTSLFNLANPPLSLQIPPTLESRRPRPHLLQGRSPRGQVAHPRAHPRGSKVRAPRPARAQPAVRLLVNAGGERPNCRGAVGEDAISGGDCGGGLGEELSARGVGLGLGCRVCVCIGLTRAVWSGKIMKITNVQPSIYARKQLARLQRSSCWIGLGGNGATTGISPAKRRICRAMARWTEGQCSERSIS